MRLYKIFLISMLFLVSVGGVCATDTDTNTTDYCLSDVNCSNTLTNNLNSNDVIYNDSNIDCCGAIAFQSVLKENGINITLEEANTAIHSVNGTTSMQGLINGAKAYNLTAYPVRINASDLQPNFIVHMNINDTNHWYVMSNVINDSDVSDKNIVLDIGEFNKYYDNNALLITKDINLNLNTLHAAMLSSLEYEKITGNSKWTIVKGIAREVAKNPYVKKAVRKGKAFISSIIKDNRIIIIDNRDS